MNHNANVVIDLTNSGKTITEIHQATGISKYFIKKYHKQYEDQITLLISGRGKTGGLSLKTKQAIDDINTGLYTAEEIATRYGFDNNRISQIKNYHKDLIKGDTKKRRSPRRRANPFGELPSDAVPMVYWNRYGKSIDVDGCYITPDGDIYRVTQEGAQLQLISLNNTGYYQTFIVGIGCLLVHRAVACTFIPTDNKFLVVDHIDDDRTNYDKDNLQWLTFSQNRQKAYSVH